MDATSRDNYNSLLFPKQFCISDLPLPASLSHWRTFPQQRFNVYTHPDLDVVHVSNANRELYLLGYMFSSEEDLSRQYIASVILKAPSIESAIQCTFPYSGVFAMLLRYDQRWVMFQDSGALKEVYYYSGQDHLLIGSEPKLLEHFMPLKKHKDNEAASFFSSQAFAKKKVFFGKYTHLKDVYHLKPNHLLELRSREPIRYFPFQQCEPLDVKYVSDQLAHRLTGYLNHAANNRKLALAITAGWDSRMLLAASRGQKDNCQYYFNQYPDGKDKDDDLHVAKRIAGELDLDLHVYEYRNVQPNVLKKAYNDSYSFPRPFFQGYVLNTWYQHMSDRFNLVGTTSETAKNYFDLHREPSARLLAYFSGYPGHPFVVRYYQEWLDRHARDIMAKGYRVIDFFHWEENIGNFVAKATTEASFGTNPYPIFNSKELIDLMLRVPLKYRNRHDNLLYKMAIGKMWPELLRFPFNPNVKETGIKWMKRFYIYQPYLQIKYALKKRSAIDE